MSSEEGDHIITEYVDGQSLAVLCPSERPPLDRAIEHLRAIARGLEDAHRQGIVHGALELANVLVTREGQTKLANFGTAMRSEEDSTPNADIRAFGALAYELVSGRSPRLDASPLAELVPDIPIELSELVERLLESRDPPTARDIEAELTAISSRIETRSASSATANFQIRHIAALALRIPPPAGSLEEVADRVVEWHRHVDEVAARYHAHVAWPSALEALVCMGYPRVHGDNAAAAANLAAELAFARPSAGIDVGKVAVLDQPNGPVIAGPAVDRALETARSARPGVALVTPVAHRALARTFRLSPLSTEPDDRVLYQLQEPLDWEARGAMVSSPLVGRADVLARLREAERHAFDAASSPSPGVLILGPPGSGKSRLLRAFLAETTAARIVFARGTEQTRSTAFATFARLLRELPEVRAEHGTSRAAIADCVTALPSGSPAMVAVVAQLLGVQTPDDDKLLAHIASYERHSFAANHLASFLAEILASNTSLLVVEDVFWLDTSSLDVLARLGSHTRERQLFLLCTSRPVSLLRHLPESTFTRHDLGPLSSAEAALLAEAAAGDWVLPPRVARAIIDRAAGIPLLVEELTQFVSTRVMAGASAAIALDLQRIPTTFADAIQERFQDLGSGTRRIAQLAASVGNEIDESVLLAFANVSVVELHSHIEVLAREGLLHGARFGDRQVYAFRHSLTRDAIYEAQDDATRLENHRAILAKIDMQFPHWESEHPEILAFQCEAAGDRQRAVRGWLAAGRRAVASFAPVVAGQHFEAALRLIAHAPAETWSDAVELEVRREYSPMLALVTNWASDEVNANNVRIRELATVSAQPLDWSSTFISLTEDLSTGSADVLSAKLGWLGAQLDETSPLADVNRYLLESMRGVASVYAGYPVRARDELERALAMQAPLLPVLRTFPVPEPILIPRMFLAWVELLEGNVAAAWEHQTTEEASHEKSSLAYVSTCCWGSALAMVAHDWDAARWRCDVVLDSDLPAMHHVTLCQLHSSLLELRSTCRASAVSASAIAELVNAASRHLSRWRGDPPRMRVGVPLYTSFFVEGCLDAAHQLAGSEASAYPLEKARAALNELLGLMREANILDRYIASEIYRLHADLLDLDAKPEEATQARIEARARARVLDVARGSTLFLERRIG
ncbi:MAG: AAA family ATPase [Labilithrix sp.]|nr:AAA family ATPase [Labilithrix sp.]